ncbi:MAG: heavy metal transport/detoxification protein [Epulopiscium sp.]|nr:heavy metal transport/detoxification protein [Candidatus Epulonipiscium sp.]
MKKKITIEGMTCEHCVRHVKNALSDIEGVENAEVNLVDKYAVIETNKEVSDETITHALQEEEYEVVKIEIV